MRGTAAPLPSKVDEFIACYTSRVNYPRKLPLYDENQQPGTWNERMIPGEFAVHYSSFPVKEYQGLYCTVFGSLDEALAHAREQVALAPPFTARSTTMKASSGRRGVTFAERSSRIKDRYLRDSADGRAGVCSLPV